MFEVFVKNPAYTEQFNNLGAAQNGAFGAWNEGGQFVPNPNIPQFISVMVPGLSATVEGANLIIIEGDGTVSAVFPSYEWNRAVKVQPQRNVE